MKKQTNKWLDSTVDTYLKYFGKSLNPIVYDVGSRDGKDGVEITDRIMDSRITSDADFWENSEIILFECNPPQQEVIKRSYPDAILIPYAISNKYGTAEFLQIHGDNNMIGSSSMDLNRANEPWVKETSIIEVTTQRLDYVIEKLKHQNKEIDVMKIDIEHYTYEALESLGKYLENVRVFHLETEIEGVARNKTNLDIALFMQERGYLCTALEHEWGDNIQDQVWVRL